ncbi:MAG: RluA family pseudouridine synthase [Actinobacteria bacterium]|nr:RluA family pseudouridine synthase [Actinomycetota bacterium]MBW3650697.1 RluA family pseudouridine synthase [Actinomycetota bacterium]
MQETIPAALAGERVDRVVAMVTGLPRSEVAALVEAGAVRLGGRPVRSRSRRVCEGDLVEVDVPEVGAPVALVADPAARAPVVHADDDVIVVDKPAGVVVHPGAGRSAGTLVQRLLVDYPELSRLPPAGAGEADRPGVVHRLDAGTSGLLVVARSPRAYHSLVAQLQGRSVERRYRALVLGAVESAGGVVDAPIGRSEADPTRMAVVTAGRPARTRYEVLSRHREPVPTTELACRLETGRTHQIRVHLAAIGHPVVGDARYGGSRPSLSLERPFLHAVRLAFDHPGTGERLVFDSPLPPDLESFRRGLA